MLKCKGGGREVKQEKYNFSYPYNDMVGPSEYTNICNTVWFIFIIFQNNFSKYLRGGVIIKIVSLALSRWSQ